jgi:uncharacterized protein (DUF302 family)
MSLQAETLAPVAAAQTPKTEQAETNPVAEEKPLVYEKIVNAEMDQIYKQVFTALENNGYYVIFEPNIGKNLSLFSARWGEEYNKNKIESIRSMVFCNGWYANKISNIDPKLLALCPLHVTLYSKDKTTHILFVLPGKIAAGSESKKVAQELQDDVIRTIENAFIK